MKTSDLPDLFHNADQTANRWLRRAHRLEGTRMMGGVLAALGGALSWKVGAVDVWASAALAGFVAAMWTGLLMWLQVPEKAANEIRLLAETTKSLAWRYAVAGSPFPATLAPAQAIDSLKKHIFEVVALHGTEVSATDPLVTPRMAEVRSLPLVERQAVYLQERVRDVQQWYAHRARYSARLVAVLRAGLLFAELTMILLAGGRAFGMWKVDLAGVLAAVAAGSAAWIGLKKHEEAHLNYMITAHELVLLQERVVDTREADWEYAVADVEETISRAQQWMRP